MVVLFTDIRNGPRVSLAIFFKIRLLLGGFFKIHVGFKTPQWTTGLFCKCIHMHETSNKDMQERNNTDMHETSHTHMYQTKNRNLYEAINRDIHEKNNNGMLK